MKKILPISIAASLLVASVASQSQSPAYTTIELPQNFRLCDLLPQGCFRPCDHLPNCGLVFARPDLVVAEMYESGCAHSESAPVLAIVIRNDGNASANASVIRVYMERSFFGYAEPSDYVFEDYIPALEPGESEYIFQRVPHWYDYDTHGVDIKVDDEEDNRESNEWNNDFWNLVTFGDC